MKFNKNTNTLTLFSFDYKSFNVNITYYVNGDYILPVYSGDNQDKWQDVLDTKKFLNIYTKLIQTILKEYPKVMIRCITESKVAISFFFDDAGVFLTDTKYSFIIYDKKLVVN